MITSLVTWAAITAASRAQEVSWQEVRGSIAETICVEPASELPRKFSTWFGSREKCALAKAATPLERAVEKGFERARPFLIDVSSAYQVFPPDLENRYEGAAADERNRIAREALLSRAEFIGPLLPSVVAALSDENLTCKDCPTFDPPSLRTLTWDEFFPYLNGFILPDPVKTPLGPDGKPSGSTRYSFHICSGLDPGSSMIHPDPVLLRSGFLAAFGNPAIQDQVGEHFGEILSEKAFQDLANDELRTSYLRGRLRELLYTDPNVRQAACDALERYVATLGVRIQGGSRGTEADAAPHARRQ